MLFCNGVVGYDTASEVINCLCGYSYGLGRFMHQKFVSKSESIPNKSPANDL